MELFNPLWRDDFAVIAAIVWAVRHLTAATDRRVEKLASDWPVTQGTVEHAGATMAGEGRTGYWVGELSYSYSVDGEYYVGVTHLQASNEDAAYEAVRGWKDRKVRVHYMPSNPEHCVLVLDEQIKPIVP